MPLPTAERKKPRIFAAYRLPAETKAEITRISHRRFYLNEDVRRSESNVIIAALALLSPSYPEGKTPGHPQFTSAPTAGGQRKPVSASVRQPYMKPGGKLV